MRHRACHDCLHSGLGRRCLPRCECRGAGPYLGQTRQDAHRDLLSPLLGSDRSLQLGGLARSKAAPARDGGRAVTQSWLLLSEVRLRKLAEHSDRAIDANYTIINPVWLTRACISLNFLWAAARPREYVVGRPCGLQNTHARRASSLDHRHPIKLTGTSIRTRQLSVAKANKRDSAEAGSSAARHRCDELR